MVMTARERVERAIRLEEVDRYPRGELLLAPGFLKNLLERTPADYCDALLGTAEALGLDLLVIEAAEASARAMISSLATGSDRFLFGLVNGPFGSALRELGELEALRAFRRCSEKVCQVMAAAAEYAVELASRCVEAGAGGVLIADDLAYARSTYLAPAELQELVWPHLIRLVDAVKDMGVPVFLHSDGCYHDIVPDLVGLGLNGLHCLDPGCGMDFQSLRRGPASSLCLWGDIDGDLVLGEHAPEEVERRVVAALASGPPRRGYIFGTCCGLPDGARVEQVRAMYRAAP